MFLKMKVWLLGKVKVVRKLRRVKEKQLEFRW